MSESDRIVFIGAGNMTEALVKGLRAAGVPGSRLCVTDVRPERLAWFREQFDVAGASDNAAASAGADVIVLAVKPQQFGEVVPSLRGASSRALFVSIAAGIPTARIEDSLGGAARVVRVMPNTPALVGAGVSALCAGARAEEADLAKAERILQAVGRTVRVPESLMDAVTAVSGSGPAYVFRVMEAMEAAAIRQGLPADVARTLVVETVAGAGRLARESGRAPADLRAQVTSKGGTTEAALRVLEARDLGGAFDAAIEAAAARARELASGR